MIRDRYWTGHENQRIMNQRSSEQPDDEEQKVKDDSVYGRKYFNCMLIPILGKPAGLQK